MAVLLILLLLVIVPTIMLPIVGPLLPTIGFILLLGFVGGVVTALCDRR